MKVFHTIVFCDASPTLGQTPFKMYGSFIYSSYLFLHAVLDIRYIYCGMSEGAENLIQYRLIESPSL